MDDRTDAHLLRLIAKDHERLAPNAHHSADCLRQIAARIEKLEAALRVIEQDADVMLAHGIRDVARAALTSTPLSTGGKEA